MGDGPVVKVKLVDEDRSLVLVVVPRVHRPMKDCRRALVEGSTTVQDPRTESIVDKVALADPRRSIEDKDLDLAHLLGVPHSLEVDQMVDAGVVADVVSRELSGYFVRCRTSCTASCDLFEVSTSSFLAGLRVVVSVFLKVAVLSAISTVFRLVPASDGAMRSWYHCGHLGQSFACRESES